MSSSPASAAHKGRILCEKLRSVLGLQPPMGVTESEGTQGVIGGLVWSHAAYQIKLFSRPARPLHNWHEWMHKRQHPRSHRVIRIRALWLKRAKKDGGFKHIYNPKV